MYEIKLLLGEKLVDSKNVKKEVYDILEMYTDLYLTWESNVSVQNEISQREVIFRGFDGNYKGEYLNSAKDWVENLGRFPVIAKMIKDKDIDGASLNSHSHGPNLFTLKMMVRKWKKITKQDGFISLGLSDVKEIINPKTI